MRMSNTTPPLGQLLEAIGPTAVLYTLAVPTTCPENLARKQRTPLEKSNTVVAVVARGTWAGVGTEDDKRRTLQAELLQAL